MCLHYGFRSWVCVSSNPGKLGEMHHFIIFADQARGDIEHFARPSFISKSSHRDPQLIAGKWQAAGGFALFPRPFLI